MCVRDREQASKSTENHMSVCVTHIRERRCTAVLQNMFVCYVALARFWLWKLAKLWKFLIEKMNTTFLCIWQYNIQWGISKIFRPATSVFSHLCKPRCIAWFLGYLCVLSVGIYLFINVSQSFSVRWSWRYINWTERSMDNLIDFYVSLRWQLKPCIPFSFTVEPQRQICLFSQIIQPMLVGY